MAAQRSLFMIAILLTLVSFATYAQVDQQIRNNYRQECLQISDFIKSDYNVECQINYHHFNSTAYKRYYDRYRASRSGKVRIGGFNVLHPGMSKTRYKDYRRIAQIIDDFDIIGVTELLPLVSDDLKNNNNVVQFLNETPQEIRDLKAELRSSRSSTKQKELKAEIDSLEADLAQARKVYRMPGYLQILHALRELDGGDEWALILSPRGEAAKSTDVQELVGFYYRSSKVKPKVNEYCSQIRTYGRGTPVACIPNMGRKMLGKDKKDLFSRRPFMGEFISGNFSFVLLASHVIYTSPQESTKMRAILQNSFGVSHYRDLSIGANKDNYARFAEVKITLDFMNQLRKRFNQEDIIFVGDMNLEYDNRFWENVLPAFPGGQLFVTDKTTVSDRRYDANGQETEGVSTDYDHFIFDPQETNECVDRYGRSNAQAYDFYSGYVGAAVRRTFRVRKEGDRKYRGGYAVDRAKYSQVERLYIDPYKNGEEAFRTIGYKKIKVGSKLVRVKGIITDDTKTEKYIRGFYERVLDSQLDDDGFYKYFSEVISDHKPVFMDCSNR